MQTTLNTLQLRALVRLLADSEDESIRVEPITNLETNAIAATTAGRSYLIGTEGHIAEAAA